MKRGGTLFNDFNYDTGLLRLCSISISPPLDEKTKIALQLIETKGLEKGYLAQINEDGNTALLLACINNMTKVALKLITKFGDQVNPGQINKNEDTALSWACFNKMDEVALELIKLGDQVIPGQINEDKNKNTALICACRNNMTEVALELITEFGDQVNPGQINENGETALKFACFNKMTDVMLELFKIYKPSDSELQYVIKNINRITAADKKKQIQYYLKEMVEVKEVTLELPPNYIIEDIIEYENYNIDDLKQLKDEILKNKILKELKDKKEDDPHTYIIYSYSVGTLGNKDYKIINVKVSTLNSLDLENIEQGLGIHTGHTIHEDFLEYIKNQPYNIYLLDFDDETIKPYILKKIVGFSEKETSQSPQKKNSSQSPQKKNSSHSSSDEY
jgi:hypothetical protein